MKISGRSAIFMLENQMLLWYNRIKSTVRLPNNYWLIIAKNALLELNSDMCYHRTMKKDTKRSERFRTDISNDLPGDGVLAMEIKFSQNLIRYRKKAGLTQSQLAAALMVTPQAVSKWEKGSYPDSELLPELARTLGVSLDALFGLKDDDGSIDLRRAAAESIQKLSPEEKGRFVMEQFYSMLCAYNSNTAPDSIRFPESFTNETFAHLRTDNELGLARLNPDMQYMCFMRIPDKGIDSYFKIQPRIIELFDFLSDVNALKVISYAETLGRNFILTKECIAGKLDIPLDVVSEIVDRFERFGIMWQLTANTGGEPFPIYGYVHNIPLVAILTLAESLVNFLTNCEPNIDIWNRAPFRNEEYK